MSCQLAPVFLRMKICFIVNNVENGAYGGILRIKTAFITFRTLISWELEFFKLQIIIACTPTNTIGFLLGKMVLSNIYPIIN